MTMTSSRRIFAPARLSAGNRAGFPTPVQIDLPGPIAFIGAPVAAGITVDIFADSVAAPPPAPAIIATPKSSPQPLRVSMGVQMAKLIRKVVPEYPPLARAARISGVVHLVGTIAKDGAIRNLQLISGHPLLARAAIDAVKQWVYQPTLLNGDAVEVIAPIDVNFTLGQW